MSGEPDMEGALLAVSQGMDELCAAVRFNVSINHLRMVRVRRRMMDVDAWIKLGAPREGKGQLS